LGRRGAAARPLGPAPGVARGPGAGVRPAALVRRQGARGRASRARSSVRASGRAGPEVGVSRAGEAFRGIVTPVFRIGSHVDVSPALAVHGCVAPPRRIFRYDFVVAPCPGPRSLGEAMNMTSDTEHS